MAKCAEKQERAKTSIQSTTCGLLRLIILLNTTSQAVHCED